MKLAAGVSISLGLLMGAGAVKQPTPYLTQGNTVTFYYSANYEGEGRMHSESYLLIKNAGTRNGLTRATGVLSYYENGGVPTSTYKMQFGCDSVNFYAAAENWLYIPVEEYKGQVSTYTHDSVCYPLNMKVGDTLRGATVSRKTQSTYGTSTTTLQFKSRKVVALDTIGTPFGNKECYRIEIQVTTKVDSNDEFRKDGYEYEFTEWFNAALGIVKTEYNSDQGSSTVVMKSPGR